MKEKSPRRFSHLISNAAMESITIPKSDQVFRQYRRTNRLQTRDRESSGSQLKFARRWTELDMWAGMIGARMELRAAWKVKHYPPIACARCLLTDCDFLEQNGHNGFEVRECRSPRTLIWFLRLNLYLC